MKIILEIHRYAPELNTAYIGPNRVPVRAAGCKSIREVRQKLFQPLRYRGRYVTLRAENTPEFERLNRTRRGFCNDLKSLAGALKIFREYHNIPGCQHVLRTKLIG